MTLPGKSKTIVVEPLRETAPAPQPKPVPVPAEDVIARPELPLGPPSSPSGRGGSSASGSSPPTCRCAGRGACSTPRAIRCRSGSCSARSTGCSPTTPPHPDCQCGIYAYHRPGRRNWFGEFDWVEGIVTVWGRIEAHRDGLRAEHARIEAFVIPGHDARDREPVVRRIAARLGADLVERPEVEDAAARYGAPLPAALLP